MGYAAVACIVFGSAAAAGGLAWLTRRRFRMETLRRHHEIGGAVFLQLGVVFAVLLAFVFSEVWSEYNTTAGAINSECASLHGAAILAGTLPPPAGRQVEDAIATYLSQVIQQEFPTMAAERGASHGATAAFETLFQTVARLDKTDSVRGSILSLLTTAHQQRETRLFQMTLGVPPLLWLLLLSFGVALVGFLLCFGVEVIISQIAFTGVFAAAIAFTLVMVALLDYPFEGALRLTPGDFETTLQKVVALQAQQ